MMNQPEININPVSAGSPTKANIESFQWSVKKISCLNFLQIIQIKSISMMDKDY